jgi:hypothetical protein
LKNSVLIIISFFIATSVCAQNSVNASQLNTFFGSKTYVVYDPDLFSDYNFYIKDAVEKNWTLTDYEFITYDVFEQKLNDRNSSFLVLSDARLEYDRSKTVYVFINLLMGSSSGNLSSMPDICNVPLAVKGQTQETFVYKLPAFVRLIQQHALRLKDNPEWLEKDLFSIYENTQQILTGKTLLAKSNELDPTINSSDKLKKHGIVGEISTQEHLEKVIEDKLSEYAFIHIVGRDSRGANCMKAIIGCGEPLIYFFGYHKVNSAKPCAILSEDLVKIAR